MNGCLGVACAEGNLRVHVRSINFTTLLFRHRFPITCQSDHTGSVHQTIPEGVTNTSTDAVLSPRRVNQVAGHCRPNDCAHKTSE